MIIKLFKEIYIEERKNTTIIIAIPGEEKHIPKKNCYMDVMD